jgi:hypothetical protein
MYNLPHMEGKPQRGNVHNFEFLFSSLRITWLGYVDKHIWSAFSELHFFLHKNSDLVHITKRTSVPFYASFYIIIGLTT